jgi:hypothetical protein
MYRVRVGDRVRQGQPIVYFDEYRRVVGAREVRETGVAIDSGDIFVSSTSDM